MHLQAHLATQRKSVHKFKLRLLESTGITIWPGLNTLLEDKLCSETTKTKKIFEVALFWMFKCIACPPDVDLLDLGVTEYPVSRGPFDPLGKN